MPIMLFGFLGPIIRRKTPEGFVLTEWTRQRYGTAAMLYLSFMTLFTLFLYMVAELSALGQVVGLLTGLDGLPVMIVQCAVTTIYTCTSPSIPHSLTCSSPRTSPRLFFLLLSLSLSPHPRSLSDPCLLTPLPHSLARLFLNPRLPPSHFTNLLCSLPP